MAEEILKGQLVEGDIIIANYEGKGDALSLKIKKNVRKKKRKKNLNNGKALKRAFFCSLQMTHPWR